ncbi:hypothetical protein H310_13753 [Aphanomyces invadans]|uniref:Uncharacterized protein n=1 Tax=Aphanomyces invadans TaxID=157072 RepID=A0A024TDK5_9STRA|nr:hypothetical protein H310_13753 [Aphanomyces invadans]ETV91676.1 hypothetical protein H310_13753 [Aphanomyces invadans]|eukprot:XP_008879602.1 hypothetical protein H310_13753 [Aphanomyces invadans]
MGKYQVASATQPAFPKTKTERTIQVVGHLYVLFTAACSALFLAILAPNISNDHWWRQFNVSRTQTFLGDLYNSKLTAGVHGPIDLFAPSSAMFKEYPTTSKLDMRRSTARALLLADLPLDQAIRIIRSMDFFENMRTMPPPCWADLNRSLEVAHTARHQVICYERRVANAAVYMETVFRNVLAADLTSSTYYPQVAATIFDGAALTEHGATWVASIINHTWVPVDDEVAVWKRFGIATFKNTLQNLYQEGVQEFVTIVNALGMRQNITVSSIPYVSRPKGAWTTAYAFGGIWNDLDASSAYASSLVRSAPNAFEAMGHDWDAYYCGAAGTVATAILRSHLGPMTVIDIFMIDRPASLLAFFDAFKASLYKALLAQNPQMYLALPEPVLEVMPRRWKSPGAVYYGGNPMCCYGNPMPYVQPSFGYYDDCGTQDRHEIAMTRDSVLFAMLATSIAAQDDVASVCDLITSATAIMACMRTIMAANSVLSALLPAASNAVSTLSPLLTRAIRDIIPLNISFVQWATVHGVDQVLHQPMVAPSLQADPWSFFGWMAMFEWANGQREVYSFEGDLDTYVLMTRLDKFVEMAASAAELPQHACAYLWVVCIYVTFVIVLVLVLVLAYSAFVGFHVDGRNLFHANRLVGGSWIGRPFLFLRGMTAMVVLSTSNVEFAVRDGYSRMSDPSRPVWHTLVLAGEVTWITYAINDIFLPLTHSTSTAYSRLSSILTFVVVAGMDLTMPYKAEAVISRECTILSFTRGLQCYGGEVHIGSMRYTGLYLVVVVGCVVGSFAMTWAAMSAAPQLRHKHKLPPNIVLTSSSDEFLYGQRNGTSTLDVAACVLSGMLPLGKSLFDVKNWVVFHANQVEPFVYSLPVATFTLRPVHRPKSTAPAKPTSATRMRVVGCLGLVYMVGAVVLSFLFLAVSRSTLVNDFVWVGFHEANVQAFLSNWFNLYLQMAHPTFDARVDSGRYGDYATTTNQTTATVLSSVLYSNSIQNDVNTLSEVVRGLRAMDSCMLPWIATAYCFADLGRQYEMAHTTTRQARCHRHETTNGAVYWEAVFGNANWATLRGCWGGALDTAVLSSVRATNDGSAWADSIQTNRRSDANEVAMWHASGITRFRTQWQNYKHLGVTESFVVSNALGLRYPLTLKKSNSSFHVSAATAFKMYWAFANDLTAVMGNDSLIMGGKSLVRGSATYAFVNGTIQSAMADTPSIVAMPLDPAYALFTAAMGPFGTVDMQRVHRPLELKRLYQTLHQDILGKLSGSDVWQRAFWDIYVRIFLTPQPHAWDNMQLWAGDINCGLNYGGWSSIPLQFFSTNGICANYYTDFVSVCSQNLLMALVAAGQTQVNATTWAALAGRDVAHQTSILHALNDTTSFAARFFTDDELTRYRDVVQQAKVVVRDTIEVELLQYYRQDDVSPLKLSRVNLFDAAEADFEVYSWLYLFEWVEGKREVVTFQGDVDQITTVSTVQHYFERPVDAQEVPVNVSLYFLALIQYITVVLCGVGCVVCVYIVFNRGYVEGINMTSFSLVAGHVWIGRPLMLVRGLTAICFLSTAKLNLVRPHLGLVSFFDSPDRSWFMTLLSSGEMAWLINVIHDTCSVLTKEYTADCFSQSALIVCVSAAIWSFAAPTRHSVTVSRDCHVVSVDFEVECVSGVVAIGDFTRFCGLIGLALGGCFTSYVMERWRHATPPPSLPWLSSFLYSAAKHKFERTIQRDWEYQGVFYLDKASATLTGVLSFELGRSLYILDIKTWRIYAIAADEMLGQGDALPVHLKGAIPLVE